MTNRIHIESSILINMIERLPLLLLTQKLVLKVLRSLLNKRIANSSHIFWVLHNAILNNSILLIIKSCSNNNLILLFKWGISRSLSNRLGLLISSCLTTIYFLGIRLDQLSNHWLFQIQWTDILQIVYHFCSPTRLIIIGLDDLLEVCSCWPDCQFGLRLVARTGHHFGSTLNLLHNTIWGISGFCLLINTALDFWIEIALPCCLRLLFHWRSQRVVLERLWLLNV